MSDLDYCQPTSAEPQINKVVIGVTVKYKQTKKSNKVSSWNWAVSSHSAVEDAPAAWPKKRKLAFLNAWRTAPRFRSALEKPGQKWRWNRIWFRCGFFCVCKKFPPYLALLCSATKALYLKSLLNVRVKNREAEFENSFRVMNQPVVPWCPKVLMEWVSTWLVFEAKQRRNRPFWIHIKQRRLISSRSSWSSKNWPRSSD